MYCIPTFSLRRLLPNCVVSILFIQPEPPSTWGTQEEQRAEGRSTEALSTYNLPIFHSSIRRYHQCALLRIY